MRLPRARLIVQTLMLFGIFAARGSAGRADTTYSVSFGGTGRLTDCFSFDSDYSCTGQPTDRLIGFALPLFTAGNPSLQVYSGYAEFDDFSGFGYFHVQDGAIAYSFGYSSAVSSGTSEYWQITFWGAMDFPNDISLAPTPVTGGTYSQCGSFLCLEYAVTSGTVSILRPGDHDFLPPTLHAPEPRAFPALAGAILFLGIILKKRFNICARA